MNDNDKTRSELIEELRQSEERFRAIAETAKDSIFTKDVERRYTYVNRAMTELFGCRREDLIGKTPEEIFDPESVKKVAEVDKVALEGGTADQVRALLIGDQERVFHTIQVPVRNSNDDITGICGIVRDITEQKRAEEELAESEKRYREMFHNMSNCVAIFSAVDDGEDFIFVDFNPAAERVEQVNKEEVIGKRVKEIFPGVTDFGLLNIFSNVWKTGKPQHHPISIYKDERIIGWRENYVYKLPGGQVVAVYSDETKRKHTEEALRESESLLRQVLDTSPNYIYVKDREGRYLLVNRRMAAMHETTPQALVGSTDLRLAEKWLTTDAEIEEFRAAELEVIDKKQVKFIPEEELTFRDGTRRWFQTTKSPIALKNNQDCLMSVSVDITDYKRLQAQIAQSDRLASMGMLAAGVAHEINNPLAYVLFNLESLTDHLPRLIDGMKRYKVSLEEHLGEEKLSQVVGEAGELFKPEVLAGVQEKFKDALGGTRRIRDTTRGLGTFSRVEKDRLEPVDLMHVIEVAVSMVFNEIKYRARLVKDYGVIPTVMASEGRLSQVFLNLLINAAHAIDEGDIENNEIRVRTWTDNEKICVEVRDTGKGIEPEHIERLFEPFFTTKEVGVGSGLGLAISKSIVEGYGGRIEVRSELGEGTSFVVCLPVGQKERPTKEVEVREKDVETEMRGRIMVIDDEREIRTAIKRMLWNYEVIEAGSGKEARQILQSDRAFDLILCDIMMPEVSGVDLHEWLVETYPSSAKQVVFITGGAFTPRTREYLSKVGNLLIEKPFDTDSFKKIVFELILAARSKDGRSS